MATEISEFYEPIRSVMGDRSVDAPLYSDAALAAAVRSAIRMNKLRDYTLTANREGITPTIDDPNRFAELVLKICLQFAAGNPDRYSYRRRPISESFGSWKEFIGYLHGELHALENNGVMFSSWQECRVWWCDRLGLPCFGYLSSCTTTTTAASTARSSFNVTFVKTEILIVGEYFLGSQQWAQATELLSATVRAKAPSSATVVELEVNGELTGTQLEIPAGTANEEVSATATLDVTVPAGQIVRWKVVSGPAQEGGMAWQAEILMEAK